MTVIEVPRPDERAPLLALAVSTGLFSPDEAESLLGGVLDGFVDGTLGAGHTVLAIRQEAGAPPVGWTYFAPDAYAAAVWNVWWIGVAAPVQGAGLATALLRHVEGAIGARQARLVVIETSDQSPMARARRFYTREGYLECGRVPDFYADGEAKVIFAKRLQAATG